MLEGKEFSQLVGSRLLDYFDNTCKGGVTFRRGAGYLSQGKASSSASTSKGSARTRSVARHWPTRL